jgi:hypothetical protein
VCIAVMASSRILSEEIDSLISVSSKAVVVVASPARTASTKASGVCTAAAADVLLRSRSVAKRENLQNEKASRAKLRTGSLH